MRYSLRSSGCYGSSSCIDIPCKFLVTCRFFSSVHIGYQNYESHVHITSTEKERLSVASLSSRISKSVLGAVQFNKGHQRKAQKPNAINSSSVVASADNQTLSVSVVAAAEEEKKFVRQVNATHAAHVAKRLDVREQIRTSCNTFLCQLHGFYPLSCVVNPPFPNPRILAMIKINIPEMRHYIDEVEKTWGRHVERLFFIVSAETFEKVLPEEKYREDGTERS